MSSRKVLLGNDSLWDLEASTENTNSMTAFSLEELAEENAPRITHKHSKSSYEAEKALQSENGSPGREMLRSQTRKESRNPSSLREMRFFSGAKGVEDDDDDDDDYFISLSKLRSMQQSPIFPDRPLEQDFPLAQSKPKQTQKGSPNEGGSRLPSLSQVGATLLYEANLRMKRTLSQHCFELLYSKRNTISLRKFWVSWNQLVTKKNVLDRDIGRMVGRIEIKRSQQAFCDWKGSVIMNKSLVQKQKIISNHSVIRSIQNFSYIWKQRLYQKRKFETIALIKQLRYIKSTFSEWTGVVRQSIERLRGINNIKNRLRIKIVRKTFYSILELKRSRKHLQLISANLSRANSVSCHHSYAKWINLLRYNQRLEQIARLTASRWDSLILKSAFWNWFETRVFSRQCIRNFGIISLRNERNCMQSFLSVWIVHFEKSKQFQMDLARKFSRQTFKFLSRTWKRIVEHLSRMKQLRNSFFKVQQMQMLSCKILFLDAWISFKQKNLALFKATKKQDFLDFRRSRQVFDVWQQTWNKSAQLDLFVGLLKKSALGTLLKEYFQSWYQLSVHYWISWRKAEKLSHRMTSTLVLVYFSSWRVRIRVRNRVIDFHYKIHRQCAVACFQAWWDYTDHEISKRGRTEEGISRMNAKRCYKQLETYLEFWYEKVCARGRVRKLQEKKQRLYHRQISIMMIVSWSRYLVKYSLLSRKLQWLNHKVSFKLLQETFAALNYWKRFSRKSNHVIVIKLLEISQKTIMFCWASWVEICRVNILRNKKYNQMIERDDWKVYSSVFDAWNYMAYVKSTLKSRLHNFIKHTAEPRQYTNYFSSWTTKHKNTKKLLQFARKTLLTQLEQTFGEFYSVVKHLQFKKYHLSSILHRVDSRLKRKAFTVWHGYKDCKIHQNVEATEMQRKSDYDCLSRTFQSFSLAIRKLLILQQGLEYFQDLQKKSVKRRCFANISGLVRLRIDYAIILDLVQSRRSEQRKQSFLGLWSDFLAQKHSINEKVNAMAERRNISLQQQTFFAVKGMAALRQTFTHIKDRRDRFLLNAFFVHLLTFRQLNLEGKGRTRLAARAHFSKCGKSTLRWWYLLTISARQMEVRLERIHSRTTWTLECAMFHCWKTFVMKAKRIFLHLIARRQITIEKSLELWQQMIDEGESNVSKVSMMLHRRLSRFKYRAYRQWDVLAAMQRNRRITILRMCHKSNIAMIKKWFRLIVAGCRTSKRARMLQAKAESKVKHDKIVSVTRFLRKIAVAKKRYRRNIERVQKRHSLTLIKDAWTSWHAKMATTNRMHQVLSKAIDLNRH
eukprot:762662-Hanusia_phi.AAC.2